MYCWDRKNFSWRSFMDYESILLLHRCIWKYDISQNCHVDLEMWYIYISKSQNCDISEMMHSHWMLVSPSFFQTSQPSNPQCLRPCLRWQLCREHGLVLRMICCLKWWGVRRGFPGFSCKFDPEKPKKCEFWPWKMWIDNIYICIII